MQILCNRKYYNNNPLYWDSSYALDRGICLLFRIGKKVSRRGRGGQREGENFMKVGVEVLFETDGSIDFQY